VTRHTLLRDPGIDRVLRDTEVSGDVVGREPAVRHENLRPAGGTDHFPWSTILEETLLIPAFPGNTGDNRVQGVWSCSTPHQPTLTTDPPRSREVLNV
jgi:hypothetical protein